MERASARRVAIRRESGIARAILIAMSKPSSTRSTIRSLQISSTCSFGWLWREGDDGIGQVGGAEGDRRVDLEDAARLAVEAGHGGVRLGQIGQDLLAALEIGSARLGEADAARRAGEEPGAQLVLEAADLGRDHAARQAEMTCRVGEALALGRPDEDLDGAQAVQGGARMSMI